jgi:cyclic pyranopterin phosphate synthase
VARRWRYLDGEGEIGIISSVTAPFCGDCSRIRLSTDGHLYTCLFAREGTDIKTLIRQSSADEVDAVLKNRLQTLWQGRGDRYSEARTEATHSLNKIEMSYIGG